jgi:hypothetical protein
VRPLDDAVPQFSIHSQSAEHLLEEGQLNVISGYATRVADQAKSILEPDPIWQTCCDEQGEIGSNEDRV